MHESAVASHARQMTRAWDEAALTAAPEPLAHLASGRALRDSSDGTP
jgi:hypothetical protein